MYEIFKYLLPITLYISLVVYQFYNKKIEIIKILDHIGNMYNYC